MAFFFIGFLKKDRKVIPVIIVVLSAVCVTEVFKSEIIKSPKILQAILYDDRSAINLTLRKNNTFEVSVATIFGNKDFSGKYKITNDKIIFLDKPYDNSFVPDTVTVCDNKIILRFDKNNKPITDFATYFDITQNHLKTIAQD